MGGSYFTHKKCSGRGEGTRKETRWLTWLKAIINQGAGLGHVVMMDELHIVKKLLCIELGWERVNYKMIYTHFIMLYNACV